MSTSAYRRLHLWIPNSGASTATEMLKMDPEAKLPWAIKMVNLTENVKNLNEDESAEAGFQIRLN